MTKGEQTRQKIVAEAASIFNRRGFEGASLAELMEATGLQKGGIYRHFSSKEELALAAFDYMWSESWRLRVCGIDKKASGLDQIRQLIANFIHVRPSIAGGCPVLNTAIDADDGNERLRERAMTALKQWRSFIERILRRAVKKGELRPGIDPLAISTLIVASLEGALMVSRLDRNQDAQHRIQKHLDHFLDTLRADTPHDAALSGRP